MGVLPDAPRFIGALAQQKRRPAQDGKVEGANPSRATKFAHVVQRRDGALKTRTVSVRVRPWAPTACSPMKRRSAQDGKVAGASPATRTSLECQSVERPSLFAKQCAPRKRSVVQVHGIPPFSACSSKRTGGFIPRIALDQCRVRERYPARRPFYTSERA